MASDSGPERGESLLEAARAAARAAYAPYSNFPVGAAVHTADGRTFTGANIENASFGLTVCAERVAIFSAVAAGARRIEAIAVAVAADVDDASERMPCGACRQVMAEFMSNSASVYVDGVGAFPLEALLPRAFRLPQ